MSEIRKLDPEARNLQPSLKVVLLAKLREYKSDLNKLKREVKKFESANANQAAHEDLLESGMVDAHKRWCALLSTCAHHDNTDMASKTAKQLLEFDPYDDSAYLIAANVFAGVGRWDEVKEVGKLMKHGRVRKEGGRS
ncbi:hypothetical protein F0562_001475 [Nyssa sinensis]|uniref:Vesicle transport v-SNARE N-terminal domain-containing protein n=1 Tax=Nyssa sinensis TaxID=561372 RepID=A0A5J5C862_9ASTE|nr:hypothetical protein F0562_001475 [Nyssa sinensis]